MRKPCPMCGGKPQEIVTHERFNITDTGIQYTVSIYIQCKKCELKTKKAYFMYSDKNDIPKAVREVYRTSWDQRIGDKDDN